MVSEGSPNSTLFFMGCAFFRLSFLSETSSEQLPHLWAQETLVVRGKRILGTISQTWEKENESSPFLFLQPHEKSDGRRGQEFFLNLCRLSLPMCTRGWYFLSKGSSNLFLTCKISQTFVFGSWTPIFMSSASRRTVLSFCNFYFIFQEAKQASEWSSFRRFTQKYLVFICPWGVFLILSPF